MNSLLHCALLVCSLFGPADKSVESIRLEHDRALIADLSAYLAANPRAADADEGYLAIFNKVIEHDWFLDHEKLARNYLADRPDGTVRPPAQIVATMARAQAGRFDEALPLFNELLAGLTSPDQIEFAAGFAENLAASAAARAEFDVARKVYAGLLKKYGDESPQVKQRVAEALARLDRIGKPAPDVEVVDIAGKPFRFSDLRGKYVLVDFWATWCTPCTAELPRIRAALERHGARGLEVVSISLDDTKPVVVDYVRDQKIPWRQIHNPSSTGDLVSEFGVTTIPATFLVDPSGRISRLELRGEALDQALATIFTPGDAVRR
ncbi:MAG: TlpA disulfide reductase family protein [Isosphaeraceae bacterium]|nr:TlpA disulfide reductase family protein [Isosphaeraceae bacterium]